VVRHRLVGDIVNAYSIWDEAQRNRVKHAATRDARQASETRQASGTRQGSGARQAGGTREKRGEHA